MPSNTAAPINRWRARDRAFWTASAGSLTATVSLLRLKMDNKPMQCVFQ